MVFRILALFAAVLAAALPGDHARAQLIEKQLHRGIVEGPVRLDPQFAMLASERAILTDLFMGLVIVDATGNIQPGAAESWKVGKNGKTWTFVLRDGQKWSDARPLDAKDFVYAFQRMLAPRSGAPYASMFYPIAGAEELHTGKQADPAKLGVKARDQRVLEITLREPTPHLLSLLTHPSAGPLRRDLIESGDESWTRPGRMVSNGPYILGQWLPGRYVELQKNWRFYDPALVSVDTVFYDIVELSEVAMERFFAGELDTLSGFSRNRIPELMQTAPEMVRLYPTLTVDYLVFNTRKPPFNDPRVRRALALAIDSQTLVNETLNRGEIPASGMLPLGMANFRPPARPQHTEPYPRMRPLSSGEKRGLAEVLLEDAGHGARDAVRVTLHHNGGETHQKVAEAIASMWKKLGVRTDLYSADYTVHYGDLGIGDFDIARAGWIPDYNDPAAILELFRSNNERFNYGGFADPEFEKLLDQALRQADPQERGIAMYRAQGRLMEMAPAVPLYHHASRNLVGNRVQGWEDNVLDLHPSRYLDIAEPFAAVPQESGEAQTPAATQPAE